MSRERNRYQEFTLTRKALQGDKAALQEIILAHQKWIYNLVIRMTGTRDAAEDITHDIILKVLAKLKTFKQKSSLKTWIYRVAVNHILDLKKSPEEIWYAQAAAGKVSPDVPDQDLPDLSTLSVEMETLLNEIKVKCLIGMLLCLGRKERLIFILASILKLTSTFIAEIVNLSAVNVRKINSRSRQKLKNFLNKQCSWVNDNAPCKCHQKAKALLEHGYVSGRKLEYVEPTFKDIYQYTDKMIPVYNGFLDDVCTALYRKQPFYESLGAARKVKEMIRKNRNLF